MNKQWDIIVAGGGMSGLCAAISAAELGASVLLIEKAEEVGGNANLSAGMMWTFKEYEKIREYIPNGDSELQNLLASNIQSTLAWLENYGLPIGVPEQVAGEAWGRCMNVGKAGDRRSFTQKMVEVLRSLGADVELNTSIKQIEYNQLDEQVIVEVENKGQSVKYLASSLVIATGGFVANPDMLERYLGKYAKNLMIRSIPSCTGDGIQLALQMGAETSGDMGTFYGHTMPCAEIPPEEFQPITPYFARCSVLIDKHGKRFTDESKGKLEETNPQAAMNLPDGEYYLIFDERIYQEYGINQNLAASLPKADLLKRMIELGATVLSAPSINELADELERIGVNRQNMINVIAEYNDYCKDINKDIFPPKVQNRIPLNVPPYYAVKCVPAISCTFGGLKIDNQFRVLNKKQEALPGIYACGLDAGGVFQTYYAGGLAWSAVSGKKAGQSAFSYVRSSALNR